MSQASPLSNLPTCYLCNKPIEGKVSDDHVPPRQFYAKAIRRIHTPNLLTLPTHEDCNTGFQPDEDYFMASVAPLAMDSYSGRAIAFDLQRRSQRTEGARLGQMVMSEFDMTPGGIHLPAGIVVKHFDGDRIGGVLWKILRGLFWHRNGRFLPHNTPRNIRLFSPNERPPEEFPYVRDTESLGEYPGVFDYKKLEINTKYPGHYWAFLLWDKILVTSVFHDPDCPCDKCETAREAQE